VILQELDAPTRALVAFAAAIALGEWSLLESRGAECRTAQVPALWIDELLLQSTLMVGWPRALTAATAWRRVVPEAAAGGEDGTDYRGVGEWLARGEAVCREVYGVNYQRLRENVRALHPALEAWMVTEGYGRTLGRPGLDLARRELCVAVQVAVQGHEPQLHAHLRGALYAGVAPAAIEQAVSLVRPMLGPRESALVTSLWERIRG